MAIRRYAQRLLNPFRGVMNVIEYQGAEAVTTDGLHWDIYVRDTELVRDIEQGARVQTSDIRYGHWSAVSGLKRGALYPSEDFKLLEHRGAVVYEDLLQHHEQVPFPLCDPYELWLLDGQDLPLALLDSAVEPDGIPPDAALDWRAGQERRRRVRSPARAGVGREGVRAAGVEVGGERDAAALHAAVDAEVCGVVGGG